MKSINIKSIYVCLLVIAVFLAGCAQNVEGESANNDKEIIEPQENNKPESKEEPKNEDEYVFTDIEEQYVVSSASDANELFDLAKLNGVIANLTEYGFSVEAAFASADNQDGFGDVKFSEETIISAATIQANDMTFSFQTAQRSDLLENANVLVYGDLDDSGTYNATEIIIYIFEY